MDLTSLSLGVAFTLGSALAALDPVAVLFRLGAGTVDLSTLEWSPYIGLPCACVAMSLLLRRGLRPAVLGFVLGIPLGALLLAIVEGIPSVPGGAEMIPRVMLTAGLATCIALAVRAVSRGQSRGHQDGSPASRS